MFRSQSRVAQHQLATSHNKFAAGPPRQQTGPPPDAATDTAKQSLPTDQARCRLNADQTVQLSWVSLKTARRFRGRDRMRVLPVQTTRAHASEKYPQKQNGSLRKVSRGPEAGTHGDQTTLRTRNLCFRHCDG